MFVAQTSLLLYEKEVSKESWPNDEIPSTPPACAKVIGGRSRTSKRKRLSSVDGTKAKVNAPGAWERSSSGFPTQRGCGTSARSGPASMNRHVGNPEEERSQAPGAFTFA